MAFARQEHPELEVLQPWDTAYFQTLQTESMFQVRLSETLACFLRSVTLPTCHMPRLLSISCFIPLLTGLAFGSQIDEDVLREHFVLEHVVAAVMDIYSELLGLSFEKVR